MSDKIYRILVVILLVCVVGLQAYNIFKPPPTPTEDCVNAVKDAKTELDTSSILLRTIVDSYQSDVYERADNVNQQILLSNENVFVILNETLRLQNALAAVQVLCD